MADLPGFLLRMRNYHRREQRYRQHGINIDGLFDAELRARYRFGREAINYITNLLRDDFLRDTKRNHSLDPQHQVLIALRFFASGSSLQVIGDTFGVDKSTVSRVITGVSAALVRKQHQFIQTVALRRRDIEYKTSVLPQSGFSLCNWLCRWHTLGFKHLI